MASRLAIRRLSPSSPPLFEFLVPAFSQNLKSSRLASTTTSPHTSSPPPPKTTKPLSKEQHAFLDSA
ncbi:MAG: hypothetical protein Q9228_005868, partial [Teloschistes exilis]